LKSGVLVLTLVPGKISAVRLAEGSGRFINLKTALPIRVGRLLNVRSLEQGLENLRRPPSVQADFELRPGERDGESELWVKRVQSRPVRLSLSSDDSGSEYTGRYQGHATLSLDNPLGLSGLFSASIGRGLETGRPYGTASYGFYYAVPFGFNQLAITTNGYDYHQRVAGYAADYEYRGRSQDSGLEFSRVVHRDDKSKTTLGLGVFLRRSHNYLDGTELEIQRRRMAGWELFLGHRRRLGKAVLEGELRYRQGTGALGALPAPEELTGEGTARPGIFTLDLRLTAPFKLGGQSFRYLGSWRQQLALDRLVSRDRLAIGGRYSVRGYDGEMTLSADNGLVFRNELGWEIPKLGQELYAAADFGRVWGPFDSYLLGKSLGGAALGLRGGFKNFAYDVFVSRPLAKPENFPGLRWVYGFHASLRF
jgi:hemolysin activation/secretion protein